MTKKKSIRVGHRGAVRKLITKIEDELEKSTEHRDEIESLCETLKKKRDILSQLDSNILDETEEENMEAEIEDADRYVLDIERILTKVRNASSKQINQSHEHSSNQNLNPNAAEFVHLNSTSTCINSNSMQNHDTHFRSSMSSTNASAYHRLPKLNLPYFDGNLLNWQPFWDAYQSTIHDNQTISDVQKFSYLKNQLQGIAAQCIAGLPLTTANYYQAVTILRERFGQTHKITNAYIQNLIDLPAPKSNADSLRNFSDKIECSIRGLESLGTSENTFGSILTPIIDNKLPSEVRKSMTRDRGNDDWDIVSLRVAIKKEVCVQVAGQTINTNKGENEFVPTATFVTGTRNGKTRQFTQIKKCLFCGESHHPNTCNNVRDVGKRIEIVKRNRVCFNCFGNHRVADCKSAFKCKQCGKKHHTSIHVHVNNVETKKSSAVPTNETPSHKTVAHSSIAEVPLESNAFLNSGVTAHSEVLLKTAIMPVWSDDRYMMTNILLDEGAQNSFITEDLARNLGIKQTEKITLKISAFGGNESQVRNLEKAKIEIETVDENRINIEVKIVPKIAAPFQTRLREEVRTLPYLNRLRLAHPISFEDKFNIDLLIGADFYWSVVEDEIIRGNGPTAVKSKIGYLLSGPILTNNKDKRNQTSMMNILTDHRAVECKLEKFWNLESLGVSGSEQVKSQAEVVKEYEEKCVTLENGKYKAKLPWKQDFHTLPHNFEVVKQRTENVIRRLQRKPELLKIYGDIIKEQERRDFIERVDDTTMPTDRPVHYMPHHPVTKESSTTPIRIVYDCSCKSGTNSPSLNDCLESHPPVMNDITGIFMRFHAKRYATTADLEKAFLQIQLDDKDRDATRFIWLSDPNDTSRPLITYRFKSVLFGATCSPFILSATLLKHFKENPGKLSETLENGLYVDNILTSFDDEKSTLEYYRTSRELMSKGGFNLRTWNSNSPILREIARKENTLDKDENTKILGMLWNAKTDKLKLQMNKFNAYGNLELTKRCILRETSKIFDPPGLLSPVTVKAKIFMQSLWKLNLDWDELLPKEICNKLTLIARDLEATLGTEIDRCTRKQKQNGRTSTVTTLHVFSDASTSAYGACAYIVHDGNPTLIMAKNRVAPIKSITLPKLELMGAVIGARLADHILSNLPGVLGQTVFWSDSQIVLSWLSSVKPQKQFIKNRINEIRDLCGKSVWKYCPTKDNPADLQTRGIAFGEFKESKLWTNGPIWLNDENNWPTWSGNITSTVQTQISEEDNDNIVIESEYSNDHKQKDLHSGIGNIIDINRHSSYMKVIRITAYVLRFIWNCRVTKIERRRDILQTTEIESAILYWIRYKQQRKFRDEFQCLENGKKRTTLVRQLKLYLDENKTIRCGGRRIDNATVIDTAKFPYLLPTKDKFTQLLILDAHERTQHLGINVTLSYIQQTFWIPKLRQYVKYVLRKCVTCRKVIGKSYSAPEIPPLPKERVQHDTPFSITGVDFTGALTIKNRQNEESKAYICLFTCAVTRAVHLELVTDLSGKSFLYCFRRCVSRCSAPKIMMSDNAQTFKNASNELSQLYNSNNVHEKILDYGIQWKFIPNRAPWFGGWWERMIGLTKTALKKVLGRAQVDEDTLRTLLTEIEATINDRPITYISTDIRDPEPLTPSHLLYGRRLTRLPYLHTYNDYSNSYELSHAKINSNVLRNRQLLENFRSRWRGEYLTSLREYHQRAGVDVRKIKEGDIVQIHDDSKRVYWKIGVVQNIIEGKDGLVRVAMVRTNSGTANRPVTKLYPLEVNNMEPNLRRSHRFV